jgi:hypothetical protein
LLASDDESIDTKAMPRVPEVAGSNGNAVSGRLLAALVIGRSA